MLLRVGYMQLLDESYQIKAETATIEKQVIQPSRGLIYDRNGKLLVFNQPIYDLFVTYNLIDPQMDVEKISKTIGITTVQFRQRIEKDWSDVRFSKNVPFLFIDKIDASVFAQLQEMLHEYPGFSVKVRNVRGYQYPHAAHTLGYISEVDQELLDNSDGRYQKHDYYGVSGLEATYEDYLRGSKGIEYQLKDNFGREVGSYEGGALDANAQSGLDVIAAIDIELQGYAELLMKGKIGSVVAIEPGTGEVLTILSSPSYHPKLLSVSSDRLKTFNELQSDTMKPFFDRSLMAKYPPGSIFKPVLSLIALQEGILTTQRYITCSGAYYYKTFRWGCHANPGTRNVRKAIEESCNTFFYTVYQELVNVEGFEKPEIGLNRLNNYLYEFGLGTALKIDLPHEQA